jgi:hypothetical protein
VEAKDFQQWHGQPGAKILQKLIEARVKEFQVKAAEMGMGADHPDIGFEHETKAFLAQAQRHQIALDVLEELFKSDPYTITLT